MVSEKAMNANTAGGHVLVTQQPLPPHLEDKANINPSRVFYVQSGDDVVP